MTQVRASEPLSRQIHTLESPLNSDARSKRQKGCASQLPLPFGVMHNGRRAGAWFCEPKAYGIPHT